MCKKTRAMIRRASPHHLCLAMALLLAGTAPALEAAAQSAVLDSTNALLDIGKDEEALAYARSAAEAAAADAASRCALSQAARENDEFDLAIEAAERCVELAPRVSGHQLILSHAYLEKASDKGGLGALGLARKGKSAVELAIKLDPNNVEARFTLVSYLLQAPRVAGGSKKEARRQAQEIAKRDPARGVWAAYLVLDQDAKDDELTDLYDAGRPLAGSEADSTTLALAALVSITYRIESDVLRERLVAQLYEAHPDDSRVAYARARLWALQGRDLESAESIFLGYLELERLPPNSPRREGAYWRLGLVYEKQGRIDEAIASYQKALEFFPDFEPIKQDLERVLKG